MDFDMFLDQLKSRLRIEDVVSEYVSLRKSSGSRFVGLCPFHSEKTPSFTVFTDDQHFYCFGCGKGGDLITFIRQIESLDYMDALRLLADKAGLDMPQERGDGEYRKRRETVLKINREAARHFHSNLTGGPGEPARAYFAKRRLSQSTITRFGLGYAPDSWDDCLKHLQGLGYTGQQIEAAGLALRGKSGGYYDRFRNRVMFPIIDTRGNVIGFGGRVLTDEQPKYLNSPDTVAFKKSNNLFALNFAKNTGSGRLILCEGYMDVISLHQAGFPEAVATLGTAITDDQSRIMARYAKEVIIAYDSDGAGRAAADKAIRLLTQTGVTVRVLSMPDSKDPDEYINKHGPDRFRRLLDGSGSHTTYRLDKARAKYDLEIVEDKAAYLKEAVQILASLPSPMEREIYVLRLAQQTDVAADVIKAEIQSIMEQRRKQYKKQEFRTERDKSAGAKDRLNPAKRQHLKAAKAEEGLLAILMKHPDYYRKLNPAIGPEDFVTDFNRNIFRVMAEWIENGKDPDVAGMSKLLTVEEVSRLTEYMINNVPGKDELRRACDYAAAIADAGSDVRALLEDGAPEDIQKYIEAERAKKEGSNGNV